MALIGLRLSAIDLQRNHECDEAAQPAPVKCFGRVVLHKYKTAMPMTDVIPGPASTKQLANETIRLRTKL